GTAAANPADATKGGPTEPALRKRGGRHDYENKNLWRLDFAVRTRRQGGAAGGVLFVRRGERRRGQRSHGREGGPPKMIAKIIEYSARNKFVVFLFVFFALAWGYYALKNIPLDAIPDLSDTQVIIYTEWEGRSPDLVEDQ